MFFELESPESIERTSNISTLNNLGPNHGSNRIENSGTVCQSMYHTPLPYITFRVPETLTCLPETQNREDELGYTGTCLTIENFNRQFISIRKRTDRVSEHPQFRYFSIRLSSLLMINSHSNELRLLHPNPTYHFLSILFFTIRQLYPSTNLT